MKKIVLYTMSIIISLSFFFSCEKDNQKNDKEKPTISDIEITWGDTIMHNGKVIEPTPTAAGEIDILVRGRNIVFSAYFKDNYALSSYKIRIIYDSLNPLNTTPRDSVVMELSKEPYIWTSIFNEQNISVYKQDDQRINDSIYVVEERDKTAEEKEQTAGKEGPRKDKITLMGYRYPKGIYFFKIYVLDRAGNEDTVTHKVHILPRKEFLNTLPVTP